MKTTHTLHLPFSQKDLILKLLKEDMVNNILVSGLEKTGLTAYPFFSDLGTLVMQLIGFAEEDCDDALYQLYEKGIGKAAGINIYTFPERAEELTEEVYAELLAEKLNRSKKS
jgi:hypothetical protein